MINPYLEDFLLSKNLKEEPQIKVQKEPKNKAKPKKKEKPRSDLLFSDIAKIIGTIGSIKNVIGNEITSTIKEIKQLLTEERKKFRSNVIKGATQAKRLVRQKGGLKKEQKEAKKKYLESQKEDLKKLLLKVQLHALTEINNRII
jgi:hypothetical protein